MKNWPPILKFPLLSFVVGIFFLQMGAGICRAQTFNFDDQSKKGFITFQSAKNLIIIPLYINGKGPYNFILDTGVGPLIITDPSLMDTLGLKGLRTTKIYGLGQGQEIEAFLSNAIQVKVAQASIQNIPTAILKQDVFNLSGYLGKKIYGLIGFYFFNSFVVKINYTANRVSFSLPEVKVPKRGEKFALTIKNSRPYIKADMLMADRKNVKVNLIVDCGASHALSMEAYNGAAFPLPSKSIAANLGIGLSGPIDGYVGRIPMLKIGKFKFKDILSSFPAYESVAAQIGYNSQDGNLGSEFLRRFDITYDYPGGYMYFKPNAGYHNSFEHDMSGMEIYIDPSDDTRYFIGRLEPESPAIAAGFVEQDEILSINLKRIDLYTLEEITRLFKSSNGKTIVFEIARNNKSIIKFMQLKRRI